MCSRILQVQLVEPTEMTQIEEKILLFFHFLPKQKTQIILNNIKKIVLNLQSGTLPE